MGYLVAWPARPGKRRMGALLALCLALPCLPLVGCGGPSEVRNPQAKVESHLQTLSVLFMQYTSENKGQSPPDEATFKKYVNGLPPERLMGKTADELFISPRDSQPYVVFYGVKMGMPGAGPPAVVAYEKTGVLGKRYIATALGGVEEVDEAKFQQLVPKK